MEQIYLGAAAGSQVELKHWFNLKLVQLLTNKLMNFWRPCCVKALMILTVSFEQWYVVVEANLSKLMTNLLQIADVIVYKGRRKKFAILFPSSRQVRQHARATGENFGLASDPVLSSSAGIIAKIGGGTGGGGRKCIAFFCGYHWLFLLAIDCISSGLSSGFYGCYASIFTHTAIVHQSHRNY